MARVVSPGELAVGMKVTIHSYKKEKSQETGNPELDAAVSTIARVTQNEGEKFIGEVMTVKAVDLPFVAVRLDKAKGTPFDVARSFDTRKVDLMELNKDYVDALQPPDMEATMKQMMEKFHGLFDDIKKDRSGDLPRE